MKHSRRFSRKQKLASVKSSAGAIAFPSQGLRVIVDNSQDNPSCPHGPTLLFEHRGTKERFFACSACRDRKDCSFFLKEGEAISDAVACAMEHRKSSFTPKASFSELRKQLMDVLESGVPQDKLFCHSCTSLIDASSVNTQHRGHNIQSNITPQLLTTPTKLLYPLQDNSKEAQYFFSSSAIKFFDTTLSSVEATCVISIGTPSLVEHLRSSSPNIPAMLLDLDWRYAMFFGGQFSWYNMFNHHFLDSKDLEGSDCKKNFIKFLQSAPARGSYVIVIDPPFGGRVEALSQTLKRVAGEIRGVGRADNIYYLWVYPYFMEPHITAELTDAKMLDYKITYTNHHEFKDGTKQSLKQGSPIRVFTNAPANLIKMPEDEGYRFCSHCQRYVASENKHCSSCRACTSKNGKSYVHCKKCKRCVKPSWKHCNKCSRCCLPQHTCGNKKIKIK